MAEYAVPIAILNEANEKYEKKKLSFSEVDRSFAPYIEEEINDCLAAFMLANPGITFYPLMGDKYGVKFIAFAVKTSSGEEAFKLPNLVQKYYNIRTNEKGLRYEPKNNGDESAFFVKLIYL